MTAYDLAQYLDSTNLSNIASKDDIKKLCLDAIKYKFKSVCVNPYYVNYAKELLKNSDVLVCTVIGFPLGMNDLATKLYEADVAIKSGADELDMVINEAEFKNNNLSYNLIEINEIKRICGNKVLKVIVETSTLTEKEIDIAAEIFMKSNADFIKTSTGFIGSGAKIYDVKKWREILQGSNKLIKASGGIRDLSSCLEFISAGAKRIGTSKAEEIIIEFLKMSNNDK